LIDLLLWFGFLGVSRPLDEELFIYDVLYDMKKLRAIRAQSETPSYIIHKAFRPFLDVQSA
jgi:hypothetical protein